MERPIYHFLLLIFLFGASRPAYAQVETSTNATTYNTDRYEDIDGDPLLFDSWIPAVLTEASGKSYEVDQLNYNGYTEEFELLKNEELIRLDEKYYREVRFTHPESGHRCVYQLGKNPRRTRQFYEVLFEDDALDLGFYKSYIVDLVEKTFHDVGKTRKVKRFSGRTAYYLRCGDNFNTVRLKKNRILKVLSDYPQAEEQVKKNKLKLKNEQEVITLLETL